MIRQRKDLFSKESETTVAVVGRKFDEQADTLCSLQRQLPALSQCRLINVCLVFFLNYITIPKFQRESK